MAFMNALTFAGIRVGGLRDRAKQAMESGVAHFPQDYPSTLSGKLAIESQASEERLIWEKKPPAKRPSWESLGTRSPWQPDWSVVLGLHDHRPDLIPCDRDESSAVHREASVWQFRGVKAISTLEGMAASSSPATILFEWINGLRTQRGLARCALERQSVFNSALVTVHISVTSRGAPEGHAHIYYLPDEEVLKWVALSKEEDLEPRDDDDQEPEVS